MKKLLKFRKNHNGFTLVELVIVIAIVIILSVISVPIYRGYVDKSKMAEGYALLGTILSAQKNYYSEHGNFLEYSASKDQTSYEPALGIDARGNKYFTWFTAAGVGGIGKSKTMFKGWTKIPVELRVDEKAELMLEYNITTGSTIYARKEA